MVSDPDHRLLGQQPFLSDMVIRGADFYLYVRVVNLYVNFQILSMTPTYL